MSTTTLAAAPPDTVRPVPWRSLGWVTWRRHRRTFLADLGRARSGRDLPDRQRPADALGLERGPGLHPPAVQGCTLAWNSFRDSHSNPGILSALFLFAPLLIGAFAGSPLLGRELETGTFRYAWTQGTGRTRWAIAMILTGAVAVAILAAAVGALITWHDQPLWQADITPPSKPASSPPPASPSSAGASPDTVSAFWPGSCGAGCSPHWPPAC